MKQLNKNLIGIAVALASTFALSQSASAKEIMGRKCNPKEVAVYSNRIHVKCAPVQGKAYTNDIPYYAERINTRSPHIRYMLDTLLAAKASGRTLYIRFDMDDYQSVPGCKGSDCRRLISVAMR